MSQVPAGWDYVETSVPDDEFDDVELIDENGVSEDDAYDIESEYEDGVEQGDWTTDDGCKFYRRVPGRGVQLVLDATDMTDAQAERAAGRIMRKEGFFPNIWYVSDHGNVSVFTFRN
jgi:hypothetical protein